MDYHEAIEEMQLTEAERLAQENLNMEASVYLSVNTKEHQEWLKHPETQKIIKHLEMHKKNIIQQGEVAALRGNTLGTSLKLIEHKTINNVIDYLIYARNPNSPSSN